MADASKISFGGNTYDLKDAAARSSLADKLDKVTTMPSTPTDGQVVMFVGATTSTYTKGHFYQYSETDAEWVDITPAGGGGTVDQTYDPTSANAQAGKAVAQAVASKLAVVSSMPASPSAGDTVLYVGTASGDLKPGHTYVYRDSMNHYAMCLQAEVSSGVYKYYDGNMQEISNPTSPARLMSESDPIINGVMFDAPSWDPNGNLCYRSDDDNKFYLLTGIDFNAWPDVQHLFTLGNETTSSSRTDAYLCKYISSTGPGWEDITTTTESIDWVDASNWFTTTTGALAPYALNVAMMHFKATKVGKIAYLQGDCQVWKTPDTDQLAVILRHTANLPKEFMPKRSGVDYASFGIGVLYAQYDGLSAPLNVTRTLPSGDGDINGYLTLMTSSEATPSFIEDHQGKIFTIDIHWGTEI